MNRTTPKRNFFIYAIWRDDIKTIFIGKSYAISTTPIISKHLSGRNRYSREYFSKAVIADGETPKIAVIERLPNEAFRTAYSHLVAWVRYALESSFYVTVQDGVIEDALSLHPGTESIYRSIQNEPLANILKQNICKSYLNPKKKEQKSSTDNRKVVQFNMRVNQKDKNLFNEFCRGESITKQQALSILLKTLDNPEALIDERVAMLKKQLDKQSKELTAAQDRIERFFNFEKHEKVYQKRYQKLVEMVNKMLKEHLKSISMVINTTPQEKIKIVRQKYSEHRLKDYSYPEGECGIINDFILLGMVYMRSSMGVFILGRDSVGNRIKLRSFPKKDYVGPMIPRNRNSEFGSRWIVGWKTASDGAVDLTASIPVVSMLPTPMLPQDFELFEENKSVDMLILKAEADKH